ncbi:MAG: peptidyl-prolyl cis-trans isomerase D [Ulvibacter sp.]|jgi:peptidyl-prolyl cis-trans isomerase D
MEKFRNLTNNIFFKVFLSFVGLSFITFGVSDLVFESNNSWVAKINGKKINQINFERELETKKSSLYGRNPTPQLLEYVDSKNFRNAVLQQIVSEEILKNLISEMDLDLNSDLAIKQILDQVEFKNSDGDFDKARFQSFLRINNLNSERYLDELNFKISSNIIFSALDIQDMKVDQDLLTKRYQFQNQKRKISLLKISQSNLKNIPEIKTLEIKKFYKNNKDKYKFDELRDVSIISISKNSLLSDIKITKDETLLEYKNNNNKYIIPEKRKLYNIFFSELSDAKKFLSKINKNKNIKPQFKNNAKELFGKEENELILNVVKSELPRKISDKVFQLEVKDISDILQSDYGYHVVYVDNIIKSKKKAFIDVKKEIKDKLFNDKSNKAIKEKISRIEDESMLLDSVADFVKKFPFAKIKKLPAINIDMISEKGVRIEYNQIKDYIEDIFFLDQDQFSELIFADDGNYYLAFVSKIIDERQKSFKEVEGNIKNLLLKEKKESALSDLAYNISVELKENPANISKITKKYNIQFTKERFVKRSNQLYPEYLTSTIFSLERGEISRAINAFDGVYYIVILNEIVLPNRDEVDKDKLIKLESEYQNDIYSEIWSKLEKYLGNKYRVEINPTTKN